MGVPKFYRWISERYPCLSEVVKEFQIPEFDNLYLDMNEIFHACSHLEDYDPHFRITEEEIFRNIMHYLEFLFGMIKPRKVFFMAVDGVAPRAKMNHKRGGKFRSAKEAEEMDKTAEEEGETLPTEKKFDTNCITPGTPFMLKLQEELKNFIVKKISTDELWKSVRVYLSGHETPGEGEHKIMDFIRHERSQPGYDQNTRHCFYGKDADLMMLGLATHEPHFTLLRAEVGFREKKYKQKRPTTVEETTFHLLHLSLFREYLDFEFSALKEIRTFQYNLENVIDDWVLMGFLVGNDFIPHLPHLHVNHDALPLLWKTYIDVLPSCGGYINEGGHLNLERFKMYMVALSKFEFDAFSDQASDLKWLEGKNALSEADKAELISAAGEFRDKMFQIELENKFAALTIACDDVEDSMFEAGAEDKGLPDTSPEDVSGESLSDEKSGDTLDDKFRNHKTCYYKTKMGYQEVTVEVLKDLAEGYVRGLQWMLLYYYKGLPSWRWFYPHHYAPYMSDVKDFKNMTKIFDLGTPFLPFEQLMAVLPRASKDLLPKPFQTLMTTDSSPVIDFYPLNFDTDLNGKQQDWEAVVLIPFIDENRLLTAMQTKESLLTEEERARNSHGPCLLYEYSPETSGVYSSSLPGAFPDIAVNHPRLTETAKDGFILPSKQLVKPRLPEVEHKVFYAGFPTLKHIHHKAELRKEGVKVFQKNSRGFNVMLSIIDEQADKQHRLDIKSVAKDYIGKDIFVGWPHLYEAKVVAVCNEKKSYSLVETKDVKGKKSGQQQKMEKEKCDDNTTNIWRREEHSIKEKYKDRLGVIIGHTKILIRALPMTGRKYVFGSHGRVTLEKQFGKTPVSFALQATVKDITVHDSSFCQYENLNEYLPKGSPVFMLGWPHYGCQGEVLEVDTEKWLVRINLSIFEEPKLSSIINNQTLHAERYFPGFIAGKQLDISSYDFSRITGTIYVATGEKELAIEQQKPQTVNIGLNLKFTKIKEEVPGYTKLTDKGWTYTQKTIDLVREYLKKFPEIFHFISEYDWEMMLYESELIPKTCNYTLKGVQEYIKSLPSSEVKPMKPGTYISEGSVSALEKEVHRVVEINKKGPKRLKKIVEPHLLFRYVSRGGAIIPDSSTEYRLFDRVVNIRQGYTVPFGLRGTVVGIHPAEVEVNTVYEVIFDEPFMGGISIRNSSDRGYRMPPSSLLNLTYGERKNGVKTAQPTPDVQNQQNYGNQFNRNMIGNRNYADATAGGYKANYQERNQYNQGYDNRNQQAGYCGFQSGKGGHFDNQRTYVKGQDDKDKYSRTPLQGNNNKSWREGNLTPKVNDNRFNRNVLQSGIHEDLSGKVFNGADAFGSQPTFVTPKVSKNSGGQGYPDPTGRSSKSSAAGTRSKEAQEKQSSDANTEFANMWKQLQSVSESPDQGTSLTQAASVLPNVTPGSQPIIDSDTNCSKPIIETDTNNSNTAQTKIDVDSLFSQATGTKSVPAEETGSDIIETVAQSKSEEANKKDTKRNRKVVSNDEFAALFKTLNEGSDDEEDTEDDTVAESADRIKKMLRISSDEAQGDATDHMEDGGSSKIFYGRQVSLQELFDGVKQQQTSTDKQQQPQNHNQQQKRENSYQKLKQQHQAPQGQFPTEQQKVYPPPLMQLQVQPTLSQKRPPLLMTPGQGGNRNPVMELISFCQSLQMGLPMYDYVMKGGLHFCIVTMVTGARFQGSLCKSREEAAESAAGVALLQMKGGMHQMPIHPLMRPQGYMPGVQLPQGRQFSSPNSAFSPVSNFTGGYQVPGPQGHFQGYNQRGYTSGQGYRDYGRGGSSRPQYVNYNSYHGNSSQQNYQNQGRNQTSGNQQNYDSCNPALNTKQSQSNRQSEKTMESSQASSGSNSANQKPNKIGLTNQNEGKTQPTCVVTPFVPLQVVKKQTPQKQRKGSTSGESGVKPSTEMSQTTVITSAPEPDKNRATKTPDKAESVKVNKEKTATDQVKPPTKDLPDKRADKTPDNLKKSTSTSSSGKKSKRRLAANFNFN